MLRSAPSGSGVWETLYSQHDKLFADKVSLDKVPNSTSVWSAIMHVAVCDRIHTIEFCKKNAHALVNTICCLPAGDEGG